MSSSSTAYSGSGSGSGSGAAGAGSGERLADVSGETPAIPRIPGSVADSPASKFYQGSYYGRDEYRDKALYLFPVDNGFRHAVIRVVDSVLFERLVLLLIVVNVVVLAVEPTAPADSQDAYRVVEFIFTSLFTVEMLLKFVASGVAFHKTAYFRSGWNWLDFGVVLAGWLALGLEGVNLTAFRALRILRALRAVRRVRGMRVLVETIAKSFWQIVNVFVLLAFFFTIFSILGLQLWGGRFSHYCRFGNSNWVDLDRACTDTPDFGRSCAFGSACKPHIGNLTNPTNPDFHLLSFDNFGVAFLTIFRIFTGDLWFKPLQFVIDGWSGWGATFILSFLFLAVAFFHNFVLVVLYDTYCEVSYYEAQQKRFQDVYARAAAAGATAPPKSCWEAPFEWCGRKADPVLSKFRDDEDTIKERYLERCGACKGLRSFLDSWVFNIIIGVLILANTVIIAVENASMTEATRDTLFIINIVFLALFGVEMVLKFCGMGFVGYFADPWNWLDFAVVFFGILEVVLSQVSIVTAFRILRVFRVFRWLRGAKAISYVRKTLDAVAASLPRLFYVVVLLLLIVFIYAVMGLHLFREDLSGPFNLLQDVGSTVVVRNNFDSLHSSFVTAFVVVTGRGWVGVLTSTMHFSPFLGVMYCVSLYLIGRLVLVNLIICVLFYNWGKAKETDADGQEIPAAKPATDNVEMDEAGAGGDNGNDGGERGGSVRGRAQAEGTAGRQRATTFGVAIDDLRAYQEPLHLRTKSNRTRTGISSIVEFAVDVMILYFAVAAMLPRGSAGSLDLSAVVFGTGSGSAGLASSPATSELFFDVVDVIAAVLFTIELVIRIGVYRKAFFTDIYSWVDIFVVATSLAGLPFSPAYNGRFLRAFRILRCLRVAARFRTVYMAIIFLRNTAKRLLGPMLLFVLFWFVSAVMGMQIWIGQMQSCANLQTGNTRPCATNYDNIGQAMLSIFGVLHTADWVPAMFQGIDAAEENKWEASGAQPELNNFPELAWFFIGVVVVNVWFTIPLFLCAIVDSFVEFGVLAGGGILQTNVKRNRFILEYIILQTRSVRSRVPPPQNPISDKVYRLVTHGGFEVVVGIIIAINTVYLCMRHYGQTEEWDTFLAVSNYVFVSLYTIEALLKIIGLGKYYFVSGITDHGLFNRLSLWNIFDFSIVVVSWVGIVVRETTDTDSIALSLFRVLRILRVFRLINASGKFYVLFLTMVVSLKAVLQFALVPGVVLAVLAVMANEWFAGAVVSLSAGDATFANFASSLLYLTRVVTFEAWDAPIALARSASDAAPVFFILAVLLVSFVLINIACVIIFDAYGIVSWYSRQSHFMPVFEAFQDAWYQKYDLDFAGHVTYDQFKAVLDTLPSSLDAVRFTRVPIPVSDDNRVELRPALSSLFQATMGIGLPDADPTLPSGEGKQFWDMFMAEEEEREAAAREAAMAAVGNSSGSGATDTASGSGGSGYYS